MATWEVTGQQADQTQITQAGQVVTGHVVYFTTGEGNSDSVFVPDGQYNANTVRRLIEARAAIADEVGSLAAGQ